MDEMDDWFDLWDATSGVIEKEEGLIHVEQFMGRPILGKLLTLPKIFAIKFRNANPWACISVTDAFMEPYGDVPISQTNLEGIIRLRFDDVPEPSPGFEVMTDEQAKQVLEFAAAMWDKCELIITHCNMGWARSPAISQVLSEIHQPEFAPIIERIHNPNKHVVRLLRKHAGLPIDG